MKRIRTKTQEAKALEGVSPRARKLYARLKDEGRFYLTYGATPPPKAMAELENAGLVFTSGRVARIVSAYVPVLGFKSFRMEEWRR